MTNSLKKSLKTWLLIALFISTNFAIAQKDPYGEKLINMNQYKTAKTYFLNKFKLNPNDAFTNYYLGQIYFNTVILYLRIRILSFQLPLYFWNVLFA